MTTSFKNYLVPDQLPDVILIKKGDLGGFVLEAIFGDVRKTAGFNGPNTLATVLNAMLLGEQTLKAVAQAQQALAAAKVEPKPEPKKRGRKPKAAVAEVTPIEVAVKRKGGRPKGSKNKPKVNGADTQAALAA